MRVEDRFWQHVSQRDPSGCWLWGGAILASGYGSFWDGQRSVRAHRYSLELVKSPPLGAHALHSCDNKRCVNPAHLSWGTHRQNMTEASERGRLPRRAKQACKNGHAMTPANTYVYTRRDANGKEYERRACRSCARERARIRRRTELAPNDAIARGRSQTNVE